MYIFNWKKPTKPNQNILKLEYHNVTTENVYKK